MDHFKYLAPRFSKAAERIIEMLGIQFDKNAKIGPLFFGDIDDLRSESTINHKSPNIH